MRKTVIVVPWQFRRLKEPFLEGSGNIVLKSMGVFTPVTMLQ